MLICQSQPLGAVTKQDIFEVIRAAPNVLSQVQSYAQSVAKIAPDAVTVIGRVMPLLSMGPQLAPAVKLVSSDIASILRNAPSYKPVLEQVSKTLQQAPQLVKQIAAITGPMATLARRLGEDPALGVFVDKLFALLAEYDRAGGPSPSLPKPPEPGVGLRHIVPWLDRAMIIAKRPWLAVAVPAAAIGAAGLMGFALGRGMSR